MADGSAREVWTLSWLSKCFDFIVPHTAMDLTETGPLKEGVLLDKREIKCKSMWI